MNLRQRTFAEIYSNSGNAKQAAIQAGYSEKTAYSQGYRLLKNVDVSNVFKDREKEICEELGVNRRWAVDQYLKVIRVSLESGKLGVTRQALDSLTERLGVFNQESKLPKDVQFDEKNFRAQIQQILLGVATSAQTRMNERMRALELMGKSLGIFSDKSQDYEGPLPWQD